MWEIDRSCESRSLRSANLYLTVLAAYRGLLGSKGIVRMSASYGRSSRNVYVTAMSLNGRKGRTASVIRVWIMRLFRDVGPESNAPMQVRYSCQVTSVSLYVIRTPSTKPGSTILGVGVIPSKENNLPYS